MKRYELPFDYTKSTMLAAKIAGVTRENDEHMNTPEKYKAFLSCSDFGPVMYITRLQKTGWRTHGSGNLCGPDQWGTVLEDRYKGQTAFLVCPGPSIKDTLPDPKAVEGKLTLSVNSAWFYAKTKYWVLAEAKYTKWLWMDSRQSMEDNKTALLSQDLITTPRAAAWWWRKESQFRAGRHTRGRSYKRMYITRFEEEGAVPFPVDGTSTFNALCTAWWMGCSDVVVFGLDLAKHGGPYVDGIPYSKRGADSSYAPQIECLKFAQWPGLTIHNVNPYSNAFGLPFKPMEKARALELLNAAPMSTHEEARDK